MATFQTTPQQQPTSGGGEREGGSGGGGRLASNTRVAGAASRTRATNGTSLAQYFSEGRGEVAAASMAPGATGGTSTIPFTAAEIFEETQRVMLEHPEQRRDIMDHPRLARHLRRLSSEQLYDLHFLAAHGTYEESVAGAQAAIAEIIDELVARGFSQAEAEEIARLNAPRAWTREDRDMFALRRAVAVEKAAEAAVLIDRLQQVESFQALATDRRFHEDLRRLGEVNGENLFDVAMGHWGLAGGDPLTDARQQVGQGPEQESLSPQESARARAVLRSVAEDKARELQSELTSLLPFRGEPVTRILREYQVRVVRDQPVQLRTYLRVEGIQSGRVLRDAYAQLGRDLRTDIESRVTTEHLRVECERILGLRMEAAALTEDSEGAEQEGALSMAQAVRETLLPGGTLTLSMAIHDLTRELKNELHDSWNGAEVDEVNEIWQRILTTVLGVHGELVRLTGTESSARALAYRFVRDSYAEQYGSLQADIANGLSESELRQCPLARVSDVQDSSAGTPELDATAREIFDMFSAVTAVSVTGEEGYRAIGDRLVAARELEIEGTTFDLRYEEIFGISPNLHGGRVARSVVRRPGSRYSGEEVAGWLGIPESFLELSAGEVTPPPGIDLQNPEGVDFDFTIETAEDIAGDMWNAIQQGEIHHVARIYAERGNSPAEKELIDYCFAQLSGGIHWRFYFHAAQASADRTLRIGLEGADGSGNDSAFGVRVRSSSSELQMGLDVAEAGGTTFAIELRTLMASSNMDGIFRRVDAASEEERRAVLRDDEVMAELRDYCDDLAYDRIYKTLTGQADLYDRLRTRREGAYGLTRIIDQTDEEGIRADIQVYIAELSRTRLPVIRQEVVAEAQTDPSIDVDAEVVLRFRRELVALSADPAIRALLEDEMTGVDLARADSLFFGQGQETHEARFSTRGDWFDDEDAMLQGLRDMTPEQRAALRDDPDFRIALMRTLTSEAEYNEAMALLVSEERAGSTDPLVELDRLTHSQSAWSNVTRREKHILAKVAELSPEQYVRFRQDAELFAQVRSALGDSNQQRFDELMAFDLGAPASQEEAMAQLVALQVHQAVARLRLMTARGVDPMLAAAVDAYKLPFPAVAAGGRGEGETSSPREQIWSQVRDEIREWASGRRASQYATIEAAVLGRVDPTSERIAANSNWSGEDEESIVDALESASDQHIVDHWTSIKAENPPAGGGTTMQEVYAALVDARAAVRSDNPEATDEMVANDPGVSEARIRFERYLIDISEAFEDEILPIAGTFISDRQDDFEASRIAIRDNREFHQWSQIVRRRAQSLDANIIAAAIGVDDAADVELINNPTRQTRMRQAYREQELLQSTGTQSRGIFNAAKAEKDELTLAAIDYNAAIYDESRSTEEGGERGTIRQSHADAIEQIEGANFDARLADYREARAKVAQMAGLIVGLLITAIVTILTAGTALAAAPAGLALIGAITGGAGAAGSALTQELIMANEYEMMDEGVREIFAGAVTGALVMSSSFAGNRLIQSFRRGVGGRAGGDLERVFTATGQPQLFQILAYEGFEEVISEGMEGLAGALMAFADPSQIFLHGWQEGFSRNMENVRNELEAIPMVSFNAFMQAIAINLVSRGRHGGKKWMEQRRTPRAGEQRLPDGGRMTADGRRFDADGFEVNPRTGQRLLRERSHIPEGPTTPRGAGARARTAVDDAMSYRLGGGRVDFAQNFRQFFLEEQFETVIEGFVQYVAICIMEGQIDFDNLAEDLLVNYLEELQWRYIGIHTRHTHSARSRRQAAQDLGLDGDVVVEDLEADGDDDGSSDEDLEVTSDAYAAAARDAADYGGQMTEIERQDYLYLKGLEIERRRVVVSKGDVPGVALEIRASDYVEVRGRLLERALQTHAIDTSSLSPEVQQRLERQAQAYRDLARYTPSGQLYQALLDTNPFDIARDVPRSMVEAARRVEGVAPNAEPVRRIVDNSDLEAEEEISPEAEPEAATKRSDEELDQAMVDASTLVEGEPPITESTEILVGLMEGTRAVQRVVPMHTLPQGFIQRMVGTVTGAKATPAPLLNRIAHRLERRGYTMVIDPTVEGRLNAYTSGTTRVIAISQIAAETGNLTISEFHEIRHMFHEEELRKREDSVFSNYSIADQGAISDRVDAEHTYNKFVHASELSTYALQMVGHRVALGQAQTTQQHLDVLQLMRGFATEGINAARAVADGARDALAALDEGAEVDRRAEEMSRRDGDESTSTTVTNARVVGSSGTIHGAYLPGIDSSSSEAEVQAALRRKLEDQLTLAVDVESRLAEILDVAGALRESLSSGADVMAIAELEGHLLSLISDQAAHVRSYDEQRLAEGDETGGDGAVKPTSETKQQAPAGIMDVSELERRAVEPEVDLDEAGPAAPLSEGSPMAQRIDAMEEVDNKSIEGRSDIAVQWIAAAGLSDAEQSAYMDHVFSDEFGRLDSGAYFDALRTDPRTLLATRTAAVTAPEVERQRGPDDGVQYYNEVNPDAPEAITVYRVVYTAEQMASAREGTVKPWGGEVPLDAHLVEAMAAESRSGCGTTCWTTDRAWAEATALDGNLLLSITMPTNQLIVPYATVAEEQQVQIHGVVTGATVEVVRNGRFNPNDVPRMDPGVEVEEEAPLEFVLDSELEAEFDVRANQAIGAFEGSADPGSCKATCERLADRMFADNPDTEVVMFGSSMHYHLRIGDIIIDPTYYQFFADQPEEGLDVFVGTEAELRARLEEMHAEFGFNPKLPAPPDVDTMFNYLWGNTDVAVANQALREGAELRNRLSSEMELELEAESEEVVAEATKEAGISADWLGKIDQLAFGREGEMPQVDSKTARLLRGLADQPGTMVEASAGRESGEMTVADAIDMALTSGEFLRVSGVVAQEGVVASDVALEKLPESYRTNGYMSDEYASQLTTMTVQFASGEIATYTGNRDMWIAMAEQSDVVAIDSSEAPYWVPHASEVSAEQRAEGYDATSKWAAKARASMAVEYSATDLPGMVVYHGTTEGMVEAVQSGPKNLGKGFGGSGLYLALEGNRELADEYAGHAVAAGKARYEHNPEAMGDASKLAPAVMEGRLNPEKELRIARIRVSRDQTVPDFENNIFPAFWADDPTLAAFMIENFDIVEVLGAADGGLNIGSNRFLVIHESAGADAILWGAAGDESTADAGEIDSGDVSSFGEQMAAEVAAWQAARQGNNLIGVQHLLSTTPPENVTPLNVLHSADALAGNQSSLSYWRDQATDAIVSSLAPGQDEPLIAKADGTIMQGNTRVTVLLERGYDVDRLPRETYVSTVEIDDLGEPGGDAVVARVLGEFHAAGLAAGAEVSVYVGEKSSAQMRELQRATGREIALVRLADNTLAYVLGEVDRVVVPSGARPIAHTHQAGVALELSPEDVAELAAADRRSHLVIGDEGSERLSVEGERARIGDEHIPEASGYLHGAGPSLGQQIMAFFRGAGVDLPVAVETATIESEGTATSKEGGVDWTSIDATREQQRVAVLEDASNPGEKIVLQPNSNVGGYHGFEAASFEEAQAILSAGFAPGDGNIDLGEHANKGFGETSAFRGTTPYISEPSSESGAAYWGDFVAEIRDVPSWNVNQAMQGRVQLATGEFRGNLMTAENEMAIPGLVYPWQVKRVGRVATLSSGRKAVRDWIDNPNFGMPDAYPDYQPAGTSQEASDSWIAERDDGERWQAGRERDAHVEEAGSAERAGITVDDLMARIHAYPANDNSVEAQADLNPRLAEQVGVSHYLRTQDIHSAELPYQTTLSDQYTTEFDLPTKLDDVPLAPVARVLDVSFASDEHSGSAGLVRLGELADGRPVALKTMPEHQDATLQEARSAIVISELGIGPQFHGIYTDDRGMISVVMDIAPGDFDAMPITAETFADLDTIAARLNEAGVYDYPDFQPYRSHEGRLSVIDPNAVSAMVGRGPLEGNHPNEFILRERMSLLFQLGNPEPDFGDFESNVRTGIDELDRLRESDPDTWAAMCSKLAKDIDGQQRYRATRASAYRDYLSASGFYPG